MHQMKINQLLFITLALFICTCTSETIYILEPKHNKIEINEATITSKIVDKKVMIDDCTQIAVLSWINDVN